MFFLWGQAPEHPGLASLEFDRIYIVLGHLLQALGKIIRI